MKINFVFKNSIPSNLPNLKMAIAIVGSEEFTVRLIDSMRSNGERVPDSTTLTLSEIANEFEIQLPKKPINIYFKWDWSNKTISASTSSYIKFNTRFHSLKSYTVAEWVRNICHELTHVVDQRNKKVRFSHKSQKDKGAAPFLIGDMGEAVYRGREFCKIVDLAGVPRVEVEA